MPSLAPKTPRSSRRARSQADLDNEWAADLMRTTEEEMSAPEAPPEPLHPIDIAAVALVDALFERTSGLLDAARQPGTVICVQVASGLWVNPVASAWRDFVWGPTEHSFLDGDDLYVKNDDPKAYKACEFTRDGLGRLTPAEGNQSVQAALRLGLPIVGFASDPVKHLPADMMRVVEWSVSTPTIDAEILTRIITNICGAEPSERLPDQLIPYLCESDLNLAIRPRQTPDEYVAKLTDLVQQRPAAEKRMAGVPTLTLHDIGGMSEAVQWGYQLAQDLEDYRAGKIGWNDVDPGVLLVGPPGTGKTTFAKALAGSCGVPVVPGSLAEWQAAGHLGDLLKAMRGAFRRARETAPCILFIDEIDAFGARAEFSGSNRDYSVQVVVALLEELDGIQAREGVVVVAACNDGGGLDPALIRSGRLDRTIQIPLPDEAALAAIFRIHLKKEMLGADLHIAARKAIGRTGADITKWVRGARRRARNARRPMAMDDLLLEIRRDSPPPLSDAMRHRAAIHECGHALITALDSPGALIGVTLEQTPTSAGSTSSMRFSDPAESTAAGVIKALRQCLAGRAAEEVALGAPSGGAGGSSGSDLARATTIAVTSLAMLGVGPDSLTWLGEVSPESVPGFLTMHPLIATRVDAMLRAAYESALETIRPRRELLIRLADFLDDQTTLSGAMVEAIIYEAELVDTGMVR